MGWFRRSTNQEELDRLKVEIGKLRQAIVAHDEQRRHEAAARAAAAARPDPNDRLDELTDRFSALEARPAPDDPSTRMEELAAKLAELDQRVTAVSTELANQVSELGNDIDALSQRPPGAGPGEEVLGELRDGQVRLANEQARYQIAFREDLARLAEQLRRPSA